MDNFDKEARALEQGQSGSVSEPASSPSLTVVASSEQTGPIEQDEEDGSFLTRLTSSFRKLRTRRRSSSGSESENEDQDPRPTAVLNDIEIRTRKQNTFSNLLSYIADSPCVQWTDSRVVIPIWRHSQIVMRILCYIGVLGTCHLDFC